MPNQTVIIIAPHRGERRDARARVRRVVAELARALGSELVIKQTEIAEAAGTQRELASRELARLERAGVVHQGRGWLRVLDLDALEAEDPS